MKGFSLVETLISILILSIALFGLAAVPIAATRLMSLSFEREKATSIALSRLEEVEAVDFASAVPSWVTSPDKDGPFSFLRTVSREGFLSTVTVRVTWAGILGEESLELSRDYGPMSSRLKLDE